MSYQSTAPDNALRFIGGVSLLLLPLLLAIAFILHYQTVSDFLVFKLVKPTYSAERLMQTLTGADGGFRLYTLPHLVGYMALPLFIPASLSLAYIIFAKAPWHALVGAMLTCMGVVFLGGVFGAWLSFASVGNLPVEQREHILPVLKALTNMQGPLMLSSALSALTFLGMIVLGFGLYQSRIVSRWYAALFILGNILILAFIDLDNWMFMGALLMLAGLFPLSVRLFHLTSMQQIQGRGKAEAQV